MGVLNSELEQKLIGRLYRGISKCCRIAACEFSSESESEWVEPHRPPTGGRERPSDRLDFFYYSAPSSPDLRSRAVLGRKLCRKVLVRQ